MRVHVVQITEQQEVRCSSSMYDVVTVGTM